MYIYYLSSSPYTNAVVHVIIQSVMMFTDSCDQSLLPLVFKHALKKKKKSVSQKSVYCYLTLLQRLSFLPPIRPDIPYWLTGRGTPPYLLFHTWPIVSALCPLFAIPSFQLVRFLVHDAIVKRFEPNEVECSRNLFYIDDYYWYVKRSRRAR